MANIVAIVGRPNVGKSTIFNRLVGYRHAIMDDESGVTRDRHYGNADWNGKYFTVIDTGGYVKGSDDIFEGAIRTQVTQAMDEASVILFVVDTFDGVTGLDEDFADVVRRTTKPVIIVANKADNTNRAHQIGEFYKLGFDSIHPISAANGSGTGDLLDEVVSHFPEEGVEDPDAGIPKIAIIGRPNVGKSSFVNALLGEDRSIVTDIAGTTRDSINARFKGFGKEFILIDTAGIRKKGKVHEKIEFYSVMRSIKAIESADVCVVLLDAKQGLEAQDVNLIGLANDRKKGILILVNKWDLVEKDSQTHTEFQEKIREKVAPLHFLPIMFISVHKKQRIYQAMEKAVQIYEDRSRKVSTSALNDVLLPIIDKYPPPSMKGKYVKIKYITQLPTYTPTFAFFCNLPQYIKESYYRFLENKLREQFGFEGVPIKLVFRQK